MSERLHLAPPLQATTAELRLQSITLFFGVLPNGNMVPANSRLDIVLLGDGGRGFTETFVGTTIHNLMVGWLKANLSVESLAKKAFLQLQTRPGYSGPVQGTPD
jgi:hypothetical protein